MLAEGLFQSVTTKLAEQAGCPVGSICTGAANAGSQEVQWH